MSEKSAVNWWRAPVEWVILAALYYGAARLGEFAALPPERAAVVWPAAGVALAAVLLRGIRVWPGIWAGAFAVCATLYLRPADWVYLVSSICVCIGIATSCLFQAWAAAALLRRRRQSSIAYGLDSSAGVLWFLCVVVVATLVSGSLNVICLGCGQFLTWESAPWVWLTWWIRDLAGVLLVTPLIVVWAKCPRAKWPLWRLIEALGMALLLLMVCGAVIMDTDGRWLEPHVLVYLLIPFTLWAAVRFGLEGVTACSFVVATATVCATVIGCNLFSYRSLLASLLALQFFMGFIAVTGLILASAFQELRHAMAELDLDIARRKEAEEALALERSELERRVKERTAALAATNTALEKEVDERRRGADALRQVNRALKTFCAGSRAIYHAKDEVALLRSVCQILINEGGYRMAWAGVVESAGGIRPVVHAGYESGYLDTIDFAAADASRLADPALRAMVGQKACLVRSFADPNELGGADAGAAVERGYASALAIPLRHDALTVGVLVVYAVVCDAFDSEEVTLLQDLANDLTHGIVALRGRIEQQRAEGERQHLQQQLYQAQKMESIGRLAGGIAHDFNNLLTPILGYAELGLERADVDSGIRDSLKDIADAAERAQKLTRQILGLSRKQSFKLEVLNLNAEASSFERMLRRIIGEDVAVTLSLDPELKQICADSAQIQQILLNLAVNARDAMPTGGTLAVSTSNAVLDRAFCLESPGLNPGPFVRLSVRDTGQGIKEEVMEHLFEPFFTTKEAGKGTGLGLATVYGVVKQHGGTVRVKSAEGKGATFEIYLPVGNAAGDQVLAKTGHDVAAPAPRQSATILIAEDDETVRRFTALVLQRQGFELLLAEDGPMALRLVAAHQGHIDLLLTDVMMPQMNGRELYTQLSGIRQDIKVLFMSGYAADVLGFDTAGEHAVNFLPKPFSMDQLLQKIRKVLES